MKTKDISLALFHSLWFECKRKIDPEWKSIPDFHFEILEFLENYQDWNNHTGCLQVFRGAAKSTLVAEFLVYRLIQDPTTTTLVLSADQETSIKVTRDCRAIILRHPYALHLKGSDELWRDQKFSVVGHNDARNPSVFSQGITGNVTSSRAKFVLFDDVEVPKNCNTESKRMLIRDRMQEADHILVPEGSKLFIGTPHTHDSIYPEVVEMGASSLKIPLLSNPSGDFPEMSGKSQWPERFTDQVIIDKQVSGITRGNFLSQYQLLPVNYEDTSLDPSFIRSYDDEISFRWANKQEVTSLQGHRLVGISPFWDPALSKASGDASVFGIIFQDEDGKYWIHRLITIKGDAETQCKQVATQAREFHVPLVRVETNGVGGFLPELLRKELRGTGIAVDGVYTTKAKSTKIIESIETPLYAGALYAHNSVNTTPLFEQMRDFRPVKFMRNKDDYIDTIASAIQYQPIRLGRGGVMHTPMIRLWNDRKPQTQTQVVYTSV